MKPKTNPRAWPTEHDDALRALVAGRTGSYRDYAWAINKQFGTSYSRSAALGRAQRMGFCIPRQVGPSSAAIEARRQREHLKKKRRRERRLAEKARDARSEQQKANRKLMRSGGASTTSVAFRRHLPLLPEMTRGELRAMLKAAVQNTAAMEVS